jgi:hypothetical protein
LHQALGYWSVCRLIFCKDVDPDEYGILCFWVQVWTRARIHFATERHQVASWLAKGRIPWTSGEVNPFLHTCIFMAWHVILGLLQSFRAEIVSEAVLIFLLSQMGNLHLSFFAVKLQNLWQMCSAPASHELCFG